MRDRVLYVRLPDASGNFISLPLTRYGQLDR